MTKVVKAKQSLADLAALHDKKVIIPTRIRAALTKLQDSGDDWIYESDFLKLVSPPIGNNDISKYRDQFADLWTETPSTNGKNSTRRVWFASKKLADKWKEQINE